MKEKINNKKSPEQKQKENHGPLRKNGEGPGT